LSGIGEAALGLAMISAILLAIFGVRLALRPEDRQRGLLMIGAAIVLVANVIIWTSPPLASRYRADVTEFPSLRET
jgi:hypothetical protein